MSRGKKIVIIVSSIIIFMIIILGGAGIFFYKISNGNKQDKKDDYISEDINKVRDLINKEEFNQAKKVINDLKNEDLDGDQEQQVNDLDGRVNSELEKINIKNENKSKVSQSTTTESNTNKNKSNKGSNEKNNANNSYYYTRKYILDYLNQINHTTPSECNSIGEANEMYNNWDNALNFLWEKLKNQLPQSEFNRLKQEEIEWIKYKENAGKEAGINSMADEGSQIYRMSVISTEAVLTRERCYVLATYFD